MRKSVLALVTGLLVTSIVHADANPITVASPDGRTQVVAQANSIMLVDVATGKAIFKAVAGKGDVTALAFSPDGKVIAGSADKSLHLWDAASGKLLRTMPGSTAPVTLLIFSADGKQLSVRDKDKVTRTFDVATGKEIRVEK